MNAIRVHQFGGPEVLTWEQIPKPTAVDGLVVVKTHSVGVNFIDVYNREGKYPMEIPFTMGREGAGVVDQVPQNNPLGFKIGDKVSFIFPNAYAEYVAVPAHKLVRIPEGINFEQACAAMIQGLTAHYLVKTTYEVKPGNTVLIHASAGGMGLLLCQLCNDLGATVIGTCSSEEKAKLSKEAGAHHVILYTKDDFVEEVKKITNGKGVNVIYDGVGKTTFLKGFDCLVKRGMMVLYGAASGAPDPINPALLVQKGSVFLTRPRLDDYSEGEELQIRAKDVFQWILDGKLKFSIGARLPLKDAVQAHKLLQGRENSGKILLFN